VIAVGSSVVVVSCSVVVCIVVDAPLATGASAAPTPLSLEQQLL